MSKETIAIKEKSPLIELNNLKRYYQSGEVVVKALDDVSIKIHQGEFVAIMGQSGSGKTTLMNIIGCLDRATGGSYHVMGRDVSELGPDELAALRRESFGFIFQRYNLLNTANAEENVEVPALYAGMPKDKRRERARILLKELGLGDRYDHRPNQLSGGQQQRVAIARSLMNDPPIILADEPTGALDSTSGQEVMALLKQLNESGRTVILITHDEQVATNAKRIIRVQDGKILEDSEIQSSESVSSPANKQDLGKQKSFLSIDYNSKKENTGNLGAESFEAVKTALRALRVNLFRTSLTLLGIIIGVAAVITMLAIGNGSKQDVLDSISSFGTNLLNIRPGMPGMRSTGDAATLTADDAKAILDQIGNIEVVVPERSGSKTLRVGNIDDSTSVEGVGEGFPIARDWWVENGTFFTAKDVESYAAVVVIGSTVAENFFPDGGNPVGQFMLLGNIPFQIIGVMESKGAAPWGGDQDDTVWVPYTTAMVRLFGSNYINSITVKVDDVDLIDQSETEITELLKSRHGVEDFSVRSTTSFLEMATETQNTLTILLGTVAAISLLVGGIGVMNIMLVSVVERTREIGVRMATGARMKDILYQFNTEAIVVCTIGGIIGIITGVAAGMVISFFDVRVVFSVAPALLAFTCSVATGVLFGYLPARKAAKLDPVIALSSE